MNEFIHPIGPHQPNYTVVINRMPIQANQSVVSQMSPVINEFISRRPNIDQVTYNTKDYDPDKKVLLDHSNREVLACLFLGLNFTVTDSVLDTLDYVSKFLRISSLSKFLTDLKAKNSQIIPLLQDCQELKELIYLEDQLFSLTDQNFQGVSSFIQSSLNKYGHSTIVRLLVNFYIARPIQHPLFYSLIEKVSSIKLNDFFYSSNSYFESFENEIHSLQSYLRNLQRPTDQSDEQIITMFMKDDIINFQKYIETHNFDFHMKLKQTEQIPSILENSNIIEIAAFYGSDKIFNYLVMNNANYSSSIVKFAIAGGNFNILHFLETSNIKVSFENSLEYAIAYHQQDIFEWLIENKETKFNANELFDQCLMYSNFKALEYLIENVSDFNTFTQICIKSSNLLLLKVISNIECLYKPLISKILEFPKSKNILFKICKHHSNEVFSFLISDLISKDKSILTKSMNENGQNLLHKCCKTNNFKGLQIILDNTLNLTDINVFLNQIDFDDFTPLKIACDNSSNDCIELLLGQPNIDPNIRQPILTFLDYSNIHLIKKFLDNPKFSISAAPKILQKVLDSNLSEEILDLFIQFERMTPDVVMNSLKSILEYEKLYKFEPLFKKIDLTYQNKKGNTILHKIYELMNNDNHIEFMKLIISINSNLMNIPNFHNQKPVFLLKSSPLSLEFMLNHRDLKLNENELKQFVDIFPLQSQETVETEDGRTFVDDDIESTDSYSDPPPLLRDEDIPGISLVSSDEDEDVTNGRVHIPHPHRNDEEYEEDEEEESMSSFIDDDINNDENSDDYDDIVEVGKKNKPLVNVLETTSSDDDQSSHSIDESTVGSESTMESQSESHDDYSQSISQDDYSQSISQDDYSQSISQSDLSDE